MARKVVVGVGIAAQPVSAAGNTWAFLQWVLGFRELGWEVLMVEHLDAAKCIDPQRQIASDPEFSANVFHWNGILERFDLSEQAALLIDGHAANLSYARDFAREAELFLNISGHFKLHWLPFDRAKKLYLDLDPAFTQIWAEVYQSDMNFSGHDCFFTVGTRLGKEGTLAPTCGLKWLPTLPPVVLKHWPFEEQREFSRFTTVAHWHGYSWCEWRGEWFKGKSDEFSKFVELPREVARPLEIATEIEAHAWELEPFKEAGWRLVDGQSVSATLQSHEDYVRGSSAEFSAAKGGYVTSQAGWFSDRSVCYLASGRPVVLQETGISNTVPAGDGLLTFRTLSEAATACNRVLSEFPGQQRAARRMAEQYFDSARVIESLLSRL